MYRTSGLVIKYPCCYSVVMVVTRTALAARNRILDATTRVLLSDGADNLTIAAVAREAGMSKGGLFYHFESKHALIEGLIDRLLGGFDRALEGSTSAPGEATRAYLRDGVSLEGAAAGKQLMGGLIGATLVEPALMEPVRERYLAWQARLENDGIDPAVASTVRMAVDGWWMSDTFDLAPPDAQLRLRLAAYLERLVDDAVAGREGHPSGGPNQVAL